MVLNYWIIWGWYGLCINQLEDLIWNLVLLVSSFRLFETGACRKEMMSMPWYNNPVITRKVLNRIANRHPRTSLQDLTTALDYATQMIWSKQEHYCKNANVTMIPKQ